MKKLLLFVLLIALSACGKESGISTSDIELDYSVSVAGVSAVETGTGDTAALSVAATGEPPMKIIWGWGLFAGPVGNKQNNAPILTHFNEKYGVQITTHKMDFDHDFTSQTRADIYMAPSSVTWEAGVTRSIPRDMLETHAPRYYAALSNDLYLSQLNKIPGGDDFSGLALYNAEENYLSYFSVYRLDWLEKLDIKPNGDLTEVFDRVYFTDQAFTQSQFTEIMNAFTYDSPMGDWETHGMYLTDNRLEKLTLAGMWGLNLYDWVNADGAAWASDAYREYLHFLRRLNERGVCMTAVDSFYWAQYETVMYSRVGWWIEDLISLLRYPSSEGRGGMLLNNDRNARLLITPPEIGESGLQGVGAISTQPVMFNNELQWVVNAHVSDEKLAKILTVFEALSFDPESWVIAHYGFEGTDFEWEGEPYESRVIQSKVQFEYAGRRGTLALSTYIFDGYAGTVKHSLGYNPFTSFIASDRGRRLIIPPYKEDVLHEFEVERERLDELYAEKLMEIITDFYRDALSGEISIDAEWDNYIDRLYANGIQEYIALLGEPY